MLIFPAECGQGDRLMHKVLNWKYSWIFRLRNVVYSEGTVWNMWL